MPRKNYVGASLDLLPITTSLHGDALCVAGFSVNDLAERFGTPLYIYDEETLRAAARDVLRAFRPLHARVSFAAKACGLIGVLATFRAEGMNLDVVSAGEMEAGLRAGFDPGQMHLHGNCKSDEELRTALGLGVHAIVVDSVDELRRIEALAAEPATVWLRLALPIGTATHPHLQTAGGSKFGIEPGPDFDKAMALTRASPRLKLTGLHAHLGSQLDGPSPFQAAAGQLAALAATLRAGGTPIETISLGGGWAEAYVTADRRLSPDAVAAALSPVAGTESDLKLAVEPGRALVARAAIAVYRVGAIKRAGGRRIVAVDGGMGDNPRPALYGARYTVLPATGVSRPTLDAADVVGRYCESGDVLARTVPLRAVAPGELLCIPVAGAYQLSMASAYNLVPPPAVVMVHDGEARLLARRSTVDDLLGRDVWDASAGKR